MITAIKRIVSFMVVASCILTLFASCKKDPPVESSEPPKQEESRISIPGVPAGWIDENEMEGLEDVTEVTLYENGVVSKSNNINSEADTKKIYKAKDVYRVFDYTTGFRVDLPSNMEPDYSLAEYVTKYIGDNLTVVVSKEPLTTIIMDNYYKETLSRYIGTDDFMTRNSTTFTEAQRNRFIGDYTIDIFRAVITGMPEDAKSFYSYVYIRKYGERDIFRFLMKYNQNINFRDVEELLINSFEAISPTGTPVNNADYEHPVIPEYWNDETEAFYKHLCETDITKWGIYSRNMSATAFDYMDYYESIGKTEFDLVLHYVSSDKLVLEKELVNEIYKRNKVLVMTVRWETWENRAWPQFDVIRGNLDNKMRAFAQQVKSVRHPIIIRMENEYNTDWTQSSGLNSMCDPEIYRDCWIRLYDIFLEVGVDNAIFMSNPQSVSDYPGQKWNSYINYLPSKYYMQIAGVTLYNMGTTAPNTNKSFKDLYTDVDKQTSQFFSNWPWIIGEFGCASETVGVDKPKWIKEMFENLHLFPNIKGALWFDLYDGGEDNILRDFRLLVPPKSIDVFMEGIRNAKKSSKTKPWKTWKLD